MRLVLFLPFLLAVACSKSSDSKPNVKPSTGVENLKVTVSSTNTTTTTTPAVTTQKTAEINSSNDPWPTPRPPAPQPPLPNQSSAQANVVWDCKNEKTGSSAQINGYVNDLERRVYLRIKKAAPVLISKEQYFLSNNIDRYCLPTSNNNAKSEYVFEIHGQLTSQTKAVATLTHYINLTSFNNCDKIDSGKEFDTMEAFNCVRGDSAFQNPDPAANPNPIELIGKTQWPDKQIYSVKSATRSLSGYTYLLIGPQSGNSVPITATIMRLDRAMNVDVGFGKNGTLRPTFPGPEMGADSTYETFAVVPDNSDGFFLYGRGDQTQDLFIAHVGSNGALKKDFLPSGFVRISNVKQDKFLRFLAFNGQVLIASYNDEYTVITKLGITKHGSTESPDYPISQILDLTVTKSKDPQILMTVESTSRLGQVIWTFDNSGKAVNYIPIEHLVSRSRTKLVVIRPIPAADGSIFIISQEDAGYNPVFMHITRLYPNGRPDPRVDFHLQLRGTDLDTFNPFNHDGRFLTLTDNSLVIAHDWTTPISKTNQISAIRIDSFGNMNRDGAPDYRSSLGMSGEVADEASSPVLLQDDSDQLFGLGTYAKNRSENRLLLLKLVK
jgi:hypothetical protein